MEEAYQSLIHCLRQGVVAIHRAAAILRGNVPAHIASQSIYCL